MRKFFATLLAATLGVVSLSSAGFAFEYVEPEQPTFLELDPGDVGELPGEELLLTPDQLTNNNPSAFTISGLINETELVTSAQGTTVLKGNADLFGIFLTGETFTATLDSLEIVNQDNGFIDDPSVYLALFDSEFRPLLATNASNSGDQLQFDPDTAGVYYLAIVSAGYFPASAPGDTGVGEQLFSGLDSTQPGDLVEPTTFFDEEGAPIPPPPLGSWAQGVTFQYINSYQVSLQGAQPVPEPAVGGSLIALAGLAVLSKRRKQVRN